MITKDLIYYFVRKKVNEFPEEWRKKLKGVRIVVLEDELRFDLEKDKSETLGSWIPTLNIIEYYIPSMLSYIVRERDPYSAMRKIESVVEHELLHATGMSHKEIDDYRKKRVN